MTSTRNVVVNQTRTFKSVVKKLHENQKVQLDKAIKQIAENPAIGALKKGELAGVRVHKVKIVNQLTLIAYTHDSKSRTILLLGMGSHENLYRDLNL